MRKTYTPRGRIIGSLTAIVLALMAMCSVIGVTVAPAHAATVPEYDIVAHPVLDKYQQFMLDTTRVQAKQVSFNEHWYQTTSDGKTAFSPLSKRAAVTVHNVGTWTNTTDKHAIDMTMSVQDWHGGFMLLVLMQGGVAGLLIWSHHFLLCA